MNQPAISGRPLLAALPLALALLVLPGAAQEPARQESEHVVKRGDTLWDLAGHYLGNPFLWPMIFEANRSVVENPHWIYPGERLRIPGVPAAAAQQPLGQPVAQPAAAEAAPRDTAGAGKQAAVTLDLRRPVVSETEFYSTPWLESAVAGQLAGRVVRLADAPSSAADRIPPALQPHYRIHIGELRGQAAKAGDSLLLVRVGREVIGYGQVVEPLAIVRVDSVGQGILLGRLLTQFQEARVGDQLVRLERMPVIPLGRPEPVANGASGKLLEFLAGQQIYGTGDRAFVAMDGETLRLGDELAVYVPGGRRDGSTEVVPATEVARARVVKVAERTATVRLTGVFDISVRAGLPVRLVARMP